MPDIKGKGLVFSIGTITYSLGITVAATEISLNQANEYEMVSEAARVKGTNGEVQAIAISNKMKRFRVTTIPAGDAIADAKSLMDKLLLSPGVAVTFADPDSAVTDATHTGKFFVDPEQGGRLTRSVDGAAQCELTLVQYVANDLSTTVS